jgi:hypothetical protein
MNINVLLKLLERVLRSVGKCVKARMHVIRGQVPVGHHAVRGQGIVSRIAVERIGKHLDGPAESSSLVVKDWQDFSLFYGCGESVKRGGEMS